MSSSFSSVAFTAVKMSVGKIIVCSCIHTFRFMCVVHVRRSKGLGKDAAESRSDLPQMFAQALGPQSTGLTSSVPTERITEITDRQMIK
jgi:hypothetical protein